MRLTYYAPALGWAVLILIGTLLPAPMLPPTPKWDLLTFDSLVHAGLFGGQLVLLLFGVRQDPVASLTKKAIICSFFLVTCFGIVVEILQEAMAFGRSSDPVDAISNTIGCFLGLGFWFLIVRRF